MIQKEVEFILNEIGFKGQLAFFNGFIHYDPFVKRDLTECLEKIKENNNNPIVVIIGQACHPNINSILDQHSAVGLNTLSCFEALLGSEKQSLDKEANTWYMTSLCYECWEEVCKILGWTEVEARLKTGFADRVLLLDAGLVEITDEKILELFDYIQVPIEIKKIDLGHLKKLMMEAIDRAECTKNDGFKKGL